MSHQDLEAVRVSLVETYYPALNRRDVEAVLALFTDDAEYLPFNVSLVEGSSYRGHDGIRKFFEDAADTWEYLHAEPQTHRTAGEHIVVIGQLRARGRHSGVEVDSPAAWVWTMRGSKASQMRVYLDPNEALDAVGLPAAPPR